MKAHCTPPCWFAACATLLGVAASACRDTTAPTIGVVVGVYSQATPVLTADSSGFPVLQCEVQFSAQATGSGSATWMDATYYFYAGANRSTPQDSGVIPAATVQQTWGRATIAPGNELVSAWRFTAEMPFGVAVAYRYQVSRRPVQTARVAFSCGPDSLPGGVPPTITVATVDTSRPVQPGDSLHLHVSATSPAGLWATVVEIVGAGTCYTYRAFSDSLDASSSRALAVRVPPSCPIGSRLPVSVTVVDAALVKASQWLSAPALVDTTPPTVAVTLQTRTGQARYSAVGLSFFEGDSIGIAVTAGDNYLLKYLIWDVEPAGIRDSAEVSGSSVQQTILIPVGRGWPDSVHVLVSARDLAGNASTTIEAGGGSVAILPSDGPAAAATVWGAVSDVAFDHKRGVVYLLQPDSARIAVFSPASLSVTGTIPLPGRSFGIDLVPGGDSLVVTLPGGLGVVSLLGPAPSVTQIPLAALDSLFGWGPAAVRVAATNVALVAVAPPDRSGVRIVSVNLATGEQRLRPDASGGGSGAPSMSRSADGALIVLNAGDVLHSYDAASDAFGPGLSMPTQEPPAVDGSGDRVAVGYNVFDANLQLLQLVDYRVQQTYPQSVLSADGQTYAVYDSGAGVVRAGAGDGKTLGRSLLPFAATFLRAAPADTLLIAIQSNTATPSLIAVLSPRQPAAAPVARVGRRH